jgi:adenylosuccinate synthase
VTCVLGVGMVINPLKLAEEMRGLESRGIDISPDRIKIAERAHLITPAHVALDGATEAQRGEGAIGTTKRGIGPAYTDKAARVGLRTGVMKQPGQFVEWVKARIDIANRTLSGIDGAELVDADATASDLYDAALFLAPYLTDVPLLLHQVLEDGKYVVAEGAQGTLLDVDHGNYPFVTSSSPTAGGALTGLGIGPKHVARVSGITKAYCTRVGSGPFPTELHDEDGDRLRGTGANPWDEFGTTTGRPRRCGWLDLVVLRYAARINGLTDLIITKLDILSGFDSLSVATAYSLGGETLTELPTDQESFARCEPIYEAVGGWQEDIMGVNTLEALPEAAQDYVGYIEEQSGLPVNLITVGPARSQTIVR